MQVIRRVQAGLQQIIDDNVELLRAQTVETLVGRVFIQMQAMLGGEDGFIYVDPQRASLITQEPNAAFLTSCFFGTGVYQGAQAQASVMLDELGRKQTLCQVCLLYTSRCV